MERRCIWPRTAHQSPSAAEQERKEIELLAADRVKALKVAGLVWCLSTSAPREFHVTAMRKGGFGKWKTTQKFRC